MKSFDHDSLESLLGQMSLRAPSDRLDAAIENLAVVVPNAGSAPDGKRGGRFGWPALITTALVASVSGLLLGQVYSLNSGTRFSIDSVADFSQSARSEPVNLTPVKFSFAAFELLHGHSTKQEYASCGACHVEGEETFGGWYYGDDDFFEKHRTGKIGKCSSCHGRVLPPNDQQEFDHEDLQGSNCSRCHKTGAESWLD